MLEHRAGLKIAQFGLDEGAQVAGSAVLNLKDQMQLVVVLDNHARTHLSGGNRHKGKTPCYGCAHCAKKIGLGPLTIVS